MQIDMLASKVSLDLQYIVIQYFPCDYFPGEVTDVCVHNADVLWHRDI